MILSKLIIFFLFSFIYILASHSIKVALCTMGKKENLYVKEFVEYYLKLGVDKIFIYDDNEPNGEKIIDVIDSSYKKVIIFNNIKKKIKRQSQAYNDCYKNNKNNFDWFLMIDMDEFLVIVNDTLKHYLSKNIFNKCDFI